MCARTRTLLAPANRSPVCSSPRRRPMPLLRLDLQEGWEDDEVAVAVDGREAFRGRVRTQLQIGLAQLVELNVENGVRLITIGVPGRGVRQELGASVAGPTYLALSLEGGSLRHQLSTEMFGYV